MGDNLDFLDEGREEATVAAEETTETAQETGKETTQGAAETTTETVTDDKDKVIQGLKAAEAAERRKRQALEQQLAEKAQEQKPDFWEDPEGRLAEVQSQFQQQLTAQKLDISEAFAREKYPDFDEKLQVFAGMAQENPVLYQQMAQQANPAEFMYRTSANQQKLKEMGDPTAYEAKLKERLRAEWEAERAAEAKKREDLPGTIANAAGSGGGTVAWSGPTPLDDLFK